MDEENQGLTIGWVCFHCWEYFPPTYKGQRDAGHHFGSSINHKPACSYTDMQIRALEAQLTSYREEDTDLHRHIKKLESDHHIALRREEEKGYARGLKDACGEAIAEVIKC
jgi:hypothetical protein